MSYLTLLCVAAFLLLAPKLQYPAFARGANPIEIFTGVSILALGILRVPVTLGDLELIALPLGALIAVGVGIAWATRAAFTPTAARDSAATAAQIALVFAVIAFLLSVIFRIGGAEPVRASAISSVVWAFLWAWLFSYLALARGGRSWRQVVAATSERLATRSRTLAAGIGGGAVMLTTAFLLGAAAVLLWLIVVLASGELHKSFSIGDALAAVLYLAAFLPNVVIAVIALSLGAPVLRGAQVGIGGNAIGRIQEVSLLDWPGSMPWYAFLLLAIPIVTSLVGGMWQGRAHPQAPMWRSLLMAATIFSVGLALLGWLGETRIGAGLAGHKGLARVAVSPGWTFVAAMIWSTVGGWLGWELGHRWGGSRA